MMKLLMIAKSNINKNKSMMLTLVVLIMFSAILLYVGASVMLKMNTFLDEKNQTLNGSDFSTLASKDYDDLIYGIYEEVGGYTAYEKMEVVSLHGSIEDLTQNSKAQNMEFVFLNGDTKESISKLKIILESEEKLPNSIVLPYYLKIAGGYNTGDEIVIKANGIESKYIIYGFAEDVMFATPSNITFYKCYIFGEEFQKLYQRVEGNQYSLIKSKIDPGMDASVYENKFIKILNDKLEGAPADMITMNYESMKTGVSIFIILIMVIIIAFSIIIMLIALTVIRFAIVTYIEGNIKNIGSLEALGYTGRELVFSTVLQFTLVALIGIILGLIVAISGTGIITNLASSSIGLRWSSEFSFTAFVIDMVLILVTVLGITYLTAAKLKKITPIVALRSGINTHNFKKNHLPLSKSTLSLNTTVGLKTLLQSRKQNIMVFIIVTLLTFVAVFSFTANYNFNVDNRAFLRLVGIEKSQVMASYYGEDVEQIFEEIGKMEEVRKTIRMAGVNMTTYLGNREATPIVKVCNNFGDLEIDTIVEGRNPIHDNEITLTGLIAKQLKAKLGDVITLKVNDIEVEFIVVGLSQQTNNLGRGASITEEGMKRINPNFLPSDLYIYLKDNEDINEVKEIIEENYRGTTLFARNMEEEFDTILASFTKAIIGVCFGCIAITLGIITIIIYLLIKIKLIKERINMGIAKAMGFTTKQLVMQMLASFSPVCILGALVGTILAAYFINPILSILLAANGIMNCHFIINPLLLLTVFISISVYSILFTILVSRSVKKITPCELFV